MRNKLKQEKYTKVVFNYGYYTVIKFANAREYINTQLGEFELRDNISYY